MPEEPLYIMGFILYLSASDFVGATELEFLNIEA
jgi:hypothetical protein